jgi:methyl-accepting chemotaxis protein
VVADEVRNLALRAADAAKNTADLIEGTVKKVKDGGELVAKTSEAFTEVAKSSSKVGELVGEIAAASQEQSKGIDQVNVAVNQMDKITQSNAANAEESASASEEMNAQAEQMKGVVQELVELVGGRGGRVESRQYGERRAEKTVGRKAATGIHKAIAAPVKRAKEREVTAHDKREVKPDEVIPMEDEADFKDL